MKLQPKADVEAAYEKEQRLLRFHEYILDSGIPKRFKDTRFKDISLHTQEIIKAVNVIKGYLKTIDTRIKIGSNGFLCGSPGTGKTMLGCLMVGYSISRGYSARYTTAFKMIQRIRTGYNQGDSVDRYIREFASKDFLVIDEIGVQHGSEDERLLLYQVLDDRSLEVRPTVIISNSKNPVEDGYLDLRISDRLKSGGGFSITLDGESYRK